MSITIALDSPVLSIPEFAKRTGQTKEAIASQMDSGALPFIQHQFRATRFVNMLKLAQICEESNADKPSLP